MRIIEISISANLFPVKYLNNRVITIFNFEVSPPPGPSFPLTYVVSIYHISIQYKGFAGSRGEYTLIIKMVMTLILYFSTRNKFALKHRFFDAHVQ